MTLGSLLLIPALDAQRQGDVALYQGIATDLMNGKLPYRDSVVEYPPYALPIFALPRLFGQGWYLNCFVALTFVADWIVKYLLLFTGLRHSNTGRALLPLLLYSAAIPFLRFFFLQRYDIYPALICVAAICLFCSGRHGLSGVAIALGLGVKVYPVLFAPVMLILAGDKHKKARFLAGLTGGLVPILLLGFFLPWWRFAEFHAGRGLQVESLYASVLWVGKGLGLMELKWEYTNKWFEVHGAAASAVLPYARIVFLVSVGVSVALVTWCAWRVWRIADGNPRAGGIAAPGLARLSLVPLLAFVAFNQVLSPQYMIWLLPLAALASLDGNVRPMVLVALAAALTPIIYPSLGNNYPRGLNLAESLVLLLRNSLLVAVWVVLIRELFLSIAKPVRVRSEKSGQDGFCIPADACLEKGQSPCCAELENQRKGAQLLTFRTPAPLTFLVAAIIFAAPQSGSSIGLDLTEPGLAYKEYQQEKPPIKRIVYEQSSDRLKLGGSGFYTADGAIQPSGYFLRFLTNSPWATNTIIWGLSSKHEWEYYPDIPNASYSPGNSWTNFQASINFPALVDLQTVACLGLPRPYPDDFRWVSRTDFVFGNPYDQYAGRITSFDGNQVKEVEFQSKDEDSPHWIKWRIAYEYDANREFPPARFVMYKQSRRGGSTVTNILHALDIGLDQNVEQGFFLKDFFPKDGKLREVYFISNRVRYLVRPDGSIVEYKYSDAIDRSQRPVRYSIIIVFLVLSVTTAVYLVRRRGRN